MLGDYDRTLVLMTKNNLGGADMRNYNIISKAAYVFENVFWAIISMICFKSILFRCIPGKTLTVSQIALWGLLLIFTTFGLLITFKSRRNNISVFVNIVLPYEIYTLLAFGKDMTPLVVAAIVTSFVMCCSYLVMIFSQKIMNEARRRQIVQRRIKFGLLGARTIAAFCMMILVIPIGINSVFGGTMAFKTTTAEVPNSEAEYTIAANIGTVSNLLQDRWDTLNLNEKANTLQTVANIEASYLGLPHELNVKIDTLRESTIAQYDDRTHTITVSITYLESMPAEEMLDSICHESYHAYQHRLIDAYNSVDVEYRDLLTFYFVPIYEEEFQNYVDGKDDDLAYYFLMCEMKARDYAEESVIDYYNKIEMYTSDED